MAVEVLARHPLDDELRLKIFAFFFLILIFWTSWAGTSFNGLI
jgi:hypothetical protein